MRNTYAHASWPRRDGKAKYFAENQQEDLEDTETIEKASGSSSSSGSRKQGGGGRSFKTSWLKLFPWCNYNPLRDIAYCTDCREVGYSSEWATSKLPPPSGWKLEYLKRHAGSLEHACVPARKRDRKEANVVFDRAQKAASRQIIGLFYNVHFLVKENVAILKAKKLHRLVDYQLSRFACASERAEASTSQEQAVGDLLPQSHRSYSSSWEIIHALNSVVEDELLNELRQANFFSCLADESTDITINQQLSLYVRYTSQGKVNVRFLKLLFLQSTTADAIASSIVGFLQSVNVDLCRLVMFTSDGANVMLGSHNGVHVKLRAHSPALLEYQCVAHREALAVGQAYETVAYLKKVEGILKGLYSHFAHSSKRLEGLKGMFAVLEMKFIKVKKLFDIRWLSRLEAVEAIVRGYTALVAYLADRACTEGDAVCEGLHKQMTTYRFVLTLHFLHDVLGALCGLNKFLQSKVLHPVEVIEKVNRTVDVLRGRYLGRCFHWGPSMTRCLALVESGDLECHAARDHSMEQAFVAFKLDVSSFVLAVINNLTSQFPMHPTIEASRIFDPSKLPTTTSDLTTYGESQLSALSQHYSKYVDASDCVHEWDELKRAMLASFMSFSFEDFLLNLACDDRMVFQYPNLSTLAEIVLAYPASNAEVERGFSHANVIKTKSLGASHLDQFLRLKLNSPDFEDSTYFEQAYHSWVTARKRRMIVEKPPDHSDSDSD